MKDLLDHSDILREGPPRQLNTYSKIKLLFGGSSFQFGSSFFWFGMLFTLIFVGQSEFMGTLGFTGDWQTVEGRLEKVVTYAKTVKGRPVYKFTFSYTVNGKTYKRSCRGFSYRGMLEGRADVEYKEWYPSVARIRGTSASLFSSLAAFVLIFPLIGLVFMFVGFRGNLKKFRLFKNGKFTRGKKLSAKVNNVRPNGQTFYDYEFEFEVSGKKYIAKCKTDLVEELEDENLEKILYNIKQPSQNLVYDALNEAPEIDKLGKLKQESSGAVLYLISGVIGFFANCLTFYLIYM